MSAGFFERLRAMNSRIIEAVQRFLLPVCLWLAYFLGLGLTWVAARLCRPEMLKLPGRDDPTFWRPAEGYAPDEEDCLRQS